MRIYTYQPCNRQRNNRQPLTPLKFRRRLGSFDSVSKVLASASNTSEDWTISSYYGTLTVAAKCGPGCQHAILRSFSL